jgi:tagatose 6-phosphate kinase
MDERGTFLCVTPNPVVDTSMYIDAFRPVYRTEADRITHTAGGKGNNVARVLVGMGHHATALTALGGASGRHVADLLAEDGIAIAGATVSGDTRITITIFDRHGEQRGYFAPNAPFTPADAGAMRAAFYTALDTARAVCLCGSSPGPEADALYPEFLRAAAGKGIPTLLDTYGEALRLGLDAAPDVIKINQKEAADLLGRDLTMRGAQVDALSALCERAGRWAALTLGAEGALFADRETGGRWMAAPPPVEAVNPIGSGDAMTAGLLAALVDGKSPEAAFRQGMAAAAANAQTWEAGRITGAEIEALLDRVPIERLAQA